MMCTLHVHVHVHVATAYLSSLRSERGSDLEERWNTLQDQNVHVHVYGMYMYMYMYIVHDKGGVLHVYHVQCIRT